MRWLPDVRTSRGVVERRFEVEAGGRPVPGVLWKPEAAAGPRPLVLIGHGATRHKRVDYILALAERLVGGHGFAAAAIDGPGHGDRMLPGRRNDFEVFSDFLAEWSRDGTTDDMVADWSATLEALRSLDEVGDGPVGYWGLSMGTIYGIPLAAAEPRIQVAVFGLMGLVGPTRERMAGDAARVTCPVVLLQQWDDSLIPRQHVFELFDALGSLDKRLHAHPGEHAAVPVEEMVFSTQFLVRHLAPGSEELG
jgi:dienelactone hydrolase